MARPEKTGSYFGSVPNNGYIDDIVGWDFENDDNDPNDSLGHGTHVGGTMTGDGTQGTQTGMAPEAMLMVQRIGSERGIQAADVWESMQYSVDMSVRLQSMSFGWRNLPAETRATWRTNCNNTIAGGTAMVVAAANSGACGLRTCVTTPGDVPAVITVGATDCNDVIAGFSSRGPVQWKDVPGYNDWPYPPGLIKPSVSAPGVNTVSAKFSGCTGYRSLSGTSMATPHVSGAIGLMIEANPNISPEEMKDILMETAVELGDPGKDNAYGAGRVNAYEAVLAAMTDPEPAACCFGNGGCKDLLRKKCLKKDGRYNFGQECGSFDCPKPGACCIDNSTCEVLLERECLAQEGDFKGEGEKCKLACPCDLIKRFKASCGKSGTIKAQVKLKDKRRDGETLTFQIGERAKFEVTIRGKKARLFTCCYDGDVEVALIDPEGCVDPITVSCK